MIIGNSTAAVGCIEGIRTQDPKGEITVVSNEPYHTYGRPLISYLCAEKQRRENELPTR
jgi:NAD(P)H-nitrite reductase large subunit